MKILGEKERTSGLLTKALSIEIIPMIFRSETRHRGERRIALISPSSNVSASVFRNAPLSDSCMDDLDVVSTCVSIGRHADCTCAYTRVSWYISSRRREINGSRNCRCRGLGKRNSVSNTVLAPLMNGWRGRTCGVGRLLANGIRSERVESRWRGGVAATPAPPSRFIFAQRAVANFGAGPRMLPAVSSETGIPDGPTALDETDGGDPRARSGRRKHAGAN